jgi:bifunctional DNA-binding transcriptional regulator/antitoxin component of YhaV-PrlF toxin-antitoxin module
MTIPKEICEALGIWAGDAVVAQLSTGIQGQEGEQGAAMLDVA